MLAQERATLTFGHTAPDAEFDAVVEGIGSAFELDGQCRQMVAALRWAAPRTNSSSGSPPRHLAWETHNCRSSPMKTAAVAIRRPFLRPVSASARFTCDLLAGCVSTTGAAFTTRTTPLWKSNVA